jgi:uncharacterized protein (TIGR00730 family)
MKAICVYCGSSAGALPVYADLARRLAAELVERDLALVYGGGNVGLMGIIADEVLRLGGKVTGVIPSALMSKEVGHRGLTELFIVKDMHERKAMMAKLSDGFIAMPGGLGTLEELFEVLTWGQLGWHEKPVALLNVNGFYDGMLDFLQHVVREGFLRGNHAAMLMHDADPKMLMERVVHYVPALEPKWLDPVKAEALLP